MRLSLPDLLQDKLDRILAFPYWCKRIQGSFERLLMRCESRLGSQQHAPASPSAMNWFLACMLVLAAFAVSYFVQHAIYSADFPTLEESDRREVSFALLLRIWLP